MKTKVIFALSTLGITVKGVWWVALAQPIILGFGAALTAVDLDLIQPILDVDWRKLLIFKKDETKETTEDDEYPGCKVEGKGYDKDVSFKEDDDLNPPWSKEFL